MLRLLRIFLEDRANEQRWWGNLSSRPSYTQLEDYPGQSEDEEAPHAITGGQIADEVGELVAEVRAGANQGY